MLGNARHQHHRYKHTAMRDRHKSALAFSQRETYYYRVVQSQTLCMLFLSLCFYSPYTLHTHVASCMLVLLCRHILEQTILFCDMDQFTPIFWSFFSTVNYFFFFLGLWSALSKITCFCCALLQQEGLIWHLLPCDLWELTDQRWWRGMPSIFLCISPLGNRAYCCLSLLLAWSLLIFRHGFIFRCGCLFKSHLS